MGEGELQYSHLSFGELRFYLTRSEVTVERQTRLSFIWFMLRLNDVCLFFAHPRQAKEGNFNTKSPNVAFSCSVRKIEVKLFQFCFSIYQPACYLPAETTWGCPLCKVETRDTTGRGLLVSTPTSGDISSTHTDVFGVTPTLLSC